MEVLAGDFGPFMKISHIYRQINILAFSGQLLHNRFHALIGGDSQYPYISRVHSLLLVFRF